MRQLRGDKTNEELQRFIDKFSAFVKTKKLPARQKAGVHLQGIEYKNYRPIPVGGNIKSLSFQATLELQRLEALYRTNLTKWRWLQESR